MISHWNKQPLITFKQTNFDGDIHAHSVSNPLVFFIYSCTDLNSVALFSVSFPNNNSSMLKRLSLQL